MPRFVLLLAALAVAAAASPTSAQTFELLSDNTQTPEFAFDISGDGRVVIGRGRGGGAGAAETWRWEGGTLTYLDRFMEQDVSPGGLSGDGSIIVGSAGLFNPFAVIWNDGTYASLPLPEGALSVSVSGVSNDGRVAAGSYRIDPDGDGSDDVRAMKWVEGDLTLLSPLPGDNVAFTTGVSGDGSVIAGDSDAPTQATVSVVWRDSAVPEQIPVPGWTRGDGLTRISADGRALLGRAERLSGVSGVDVLAFLSIDGTIIELGTWLDNSDPTLDTYPRYTLSDLSADGSIVVGVRENGPPSFDATQVIWDAVNGWRQLETVFREAGMDLQGRTLWPGSFVRISDDGTVIAGNAREGDAGRLEPYRAVLVPTENDLTVNDASDDADADLNDDVCDVDVSQPGNQCTLRAAIATSNRRSGPRNAITFDLDGPGPHTIAVASQFEEIIVPIVLDATTQPGYTGTPVVSLRGGGTLGLVVGAGNSVVRGLSIGGFTAGLFFGGQGGNVVEACHIGVDASGTMVVPNDIGVVINQTPNHRVGGEQPAQRNVISGNTQVAFQILGAASAGTVIEGNYIGTNAAGTAALPNSGGGLVVDGTTGVTIGGATPGARNVIAGNGAAGVTVIGASTSGLVISANTIGLNAAGTDALPNNGEGVRVLNAPSVRIGGATAGERNLISGNATHGVHVAGPESSGVAVAGNWIGLAANGTTAVPNGTDDTRQSGHHGVFVVNAPGVTIGGASAAPGAAPGNVIAGNAAHEVYVTAAPDQPATGVQILGSLLGTDASGSAAVVAGQEAVVVTGAVPGMQVGAAGAGNVVVAGTEGEGGSRGGVFLVDLGPGGAPDGATVAGNLVGLNAAGSAPLGQVGTGIAVTTDVDNGGVENVTIGGDVGGGAGNRVAGVLGIVVEFPRSSGAVVEGNTVGLLASGALARAEPDGIGLVILGANEVQVVDNTIGGQAIGLALASDDSAVLGNRIGTDPAGGEARPNTVGFVVYGRVEGGLAVGDRNQVGAAGAGNVISGNENGGLRLGGVLEVGPALTATAWARIRAKQGGDEAVARLGNQSPDENTIAFNRIGTDAGGTRALGNGRAPTAEEAFPGVWVRDGRANQLVGNVISGNGAGVLVSFDEETGGSPRETLIGGNVVGGSLNRTASIPNQYGGVILVASPDNRLAAVALEEGGEPVPNLIRGNGSRGVRVVTLEGETGNQIRGTSFFRNDGPSIELNDADNGYPAVAAPVPQVFWATSADEGGATLRLRTDAAGEVDVFASTRCPSGNAEGSILGFSEVAGGATSVTVPDLLPDTSPLVQFLAVTLTPPGPVATTSAFSDCVRIARPEDVVEAVVDDGETGMVVDDADIEVEITDNAAPRTRGRLASLNTEVDARAGGTLYVSRFGERIVPEPSPIDGSALAPDGSTVTPNAVSLNRHWTLRTEGLGGVTYTACLDTEGVNGIIVPGQLLVLHRPDAGTPWTPFPSSLDDTRLCATGLTAWGDLGIGADTLVNPVPNEPGPGEAPEALPTAFGVQVWPNPSMHIATVEIALPEAAKTRTDVYDVLGRRMAMLHEGPLAAGTHALALDAARLPAGTYIVRTVIVRTVTPMATLTRRFTVVR